MTLHRGYFLAISGQTSQAHPHQPLPLHHPISMGYSVWLQPAVPLCSHPAKQWLLAGSGVAPSSVATRLPCSSPKIAIPPGGHDSDSCVPAQGWILGSLLCPLT